jgi:hypothetical protein
MDKKFIFGSPDNYYYDANICAYINKYTQKITTFEAIKNNELKIVNNIVNQIERPTYK